MREIKTKLTAINRPFLVDAFDRRVGFVLIKLRPAIAIQELSLAVDIIVRIAILGPAKKENHVNLGKISKRVRPSAE